MKGFANPASVCVNILLSLGLSMHAWVLQAEQRVPNGYGSITIPIEGLEKTHYCSEENDGDDVVNFTYYLAFQGSEKTLKDFHSKTCRLFSESLENSATPPPENGSFCSDQSPIGLGYSKAISFYRHKYSYPRVCEYMKNSFNEAKVFLNFALSWKTGPAQLTCGHQPSCGKVITWDFKSHLVMDLPYGKQVVEPVGRATSNQTSVWVDMSECAGLPQYDCPEDPRP